MDVAEGGDNNSEGIVDGSLEVLLLVILKFKTVSHCGEHIAVAALVNHSKEKKARTR